MLSKEEFLKEYIYRFDESFPYRLLSRMKEDCKYFLGNGNRFVGHLWAGEGAETHIQYMKYIWEYLPEKPEWLTMEEIEKFAEQMIEKE